MEILNRMNEEQHKRLNEQRSALQKRNEDVSDLDRRIEDLTLRLRQKRLANGMIAGGEDWRQSDLPSSKMHTIVAAVEPLMKHANPVSSYPPPSATTSLQVSRDFLQVSRAFSLNLTPKRHWLQGNNGEGCFCPLWRLLNFVYDNTIKLCYTCRSYNKQLKKRKVGALNYFLNQWFPTFLIATPCKRLAPAISCNYKGVGITTDKIKKHWLCLSRIN